MVDVAAEKNSTLVMPFPVELLRFFDRAATAGHHATQSAADVAPADQAGPVNTPQAHQAWDAATTVPSDQPEHPVGAKA